MKDRFTVELRLGKTGARFAQDLIGLPEFTVLPLKSLHSLGHVCRHASSLAGVYLRLLHPIQRVCAEQPIFADID